MTTGQEGIEELARLLHEAGREAVERNLLVRDDVPPRPFVEWGDLTEAAQEGRRVQARYLVNTDAGDLILAAAGRAVPRRGIAALRQTQTHTYAVLAVSKRTHDEILSKLGAAGYQHAFMADGENGVVIDMHGIALEAEP